jgi:arylsulfatase A-like enzyme
MYKYVSMKLVLIQKLKTLVLMIGLSACLSGLTLQASAKNLQENNQNTDYNVVVIHVDDLGWRDLGCMGSPVYETPNIDRLAKSGTLYTSAYASASICSPSRACLLTGSQPSRHGVYTVVKNRGSKTHWKVTPIKNKQYLNKDYPTIASVLTKAGIANGSMGKWHVSGQVPSHGFNEGKWGGYLGLPINYFAPFKLSFLPKDAPKGAYLPTYIRQAGVDFLKSHQKEQFFLYFSTYLPHDEINNKGEDPDATGTFRLSGPKVVVDKYRAKIKKMKEEKKDLKGHDNPVFAAMVEETDRSVGAIIDTLDKLKLREKTLILFISDNGGLSKYSSQFPLRGQKVSMYEGGIRVPMIASMPGRIAADKKNDEPVSGIDFYPTICNVMGVEPLYQPWVDGEDLTDLLFEGKALPERNLFWTFPIYSKPSLASRSPRSVMRRGHWKIHHRFEDKGYELYNLKEDIGETKDLSSSHPKELELMKTEIISCYKRFGSSKRLRPNPEYNKVEHAAECLKADKEAIPTLKTTAQVYSELGLQ